MATCDSHHEAAVLYCDQCAAFLCARCEDAGVHATHRLCTIQRAFRLLRDDADASTRRLRELHTQTAQSRPQTGNLRGAEVCVPDAVEDGMLALFGEVELKLAALKEECMREYWTEKEKLRVAKWGAHGRANLREMERALYQLRSCLCDETCDAKKLRDECRAARALIQRIEAPQAAHVQRTGPATQSGAGPVGERVGFVGDVAMRDSLASEFLHELQRALLPAMVCPWLVAARGAHFTQLGLLSNDFESLFPRFSPLEFIYGGFIYSVFQIKYVEELQIEKRALEEHIGRLQEEMTRLTEMIRKLSTLIPLHC